MAKKTAVVSFGRMSPPTNGHEKLVNAVTSIARKENGDAQIYVSHSYDKKKNPLKYEDKVRFLKTAFGPIVKQSTAKTFIDVAKSLSGKFENLVFVVGSDRVPEFERVLNKYNGSEFNFASVKVVSAGERDPDADDVSGMSASKMRSFVSAGDFESFKSGLPKKLIPHAKEVYDMTKEGMGLHEGLEDDEVLVEETLDEAGVVSLQQRRKRGLKMRAIKGRLKMARERAKRRMASGEKLKQRAARKARMSMRSRMSGGKKYSDMSASQKMAVDKRMERIPDSVIKRLAQRQLPIVRRAEIARLSNARKGNAADNSKHGITVAKYANTDKKESFDINEMFMAFIIERKVESFSDFLAEARTSTDGTPSKRYHQLFNKDKSVKADARFSMFKKKPQHDCGCDNVKEDGEVISGSRNDVKLDKRHRMFAGKPYAVKDPVRKKLSEQIETLADMTESFIAEMSNEDYELVKTKDKVSTTAHPNGKNIFHVHYKGQHLATLTPYSSHKDTFSKGSRIPSSRKSVTHYKIDWKNDSDAIPTMRHSSSSYKHGHAQPSHALEKIRQYHKKPVSEALGQDREWGTSSLTTQLKNDTPGQEGFLPIQNGYHQIKKGSQVWFNLRSVYGVGQLAKGQPIQGTLVGGDVNKARVRDANGKLYRVDWEHIDRHD